MSFDSRLDRLLDGRPADLVAAVTASRMVFRVAHLLEKRIDEALQPFGIGMRDYLALNLIADNAVEPLRPSDLGATLDATRTQITRLLDGLEAKGLARRLAGAADRRSLHLALTPAGKTLVRRAAAAVHPVYAAAWNEAGPTHTARALASLRSVHAALAKPDEA